MSQNKDSQRANPPPGGPAGDPFETLHKISAASAEVMSAWGETWGAMMKNRGAPISEALTKTFAAPAPWPTTLVPILDEIRSALKLPTFSDMPGRDLFALPSPAPMLGLLQVSQEYAAIGMPIWIKTCERFLAEAKKRQDAADGNNVDSGELLDVWNNVLDVTLMEFNRSGEFARAQQGLLQAAAQQRRELGSAVEKLANMAGMPTRTEMTEVYRRLHSLNREIHALRKEVRALRRKPSDAVGAGDAA